MLDITKNDIAALADDDLRDLVARLCEAEMRKRCFSASAVTWGGAQDAPDGGIDVRVDLPAGTVVEGFIPRAATGFQVKKPDMAASDVTAEMRPNGTIRPSIQALADKGGGYIIVSGNGSTADSALKSRRDAMSAAVKGIPNGKSLALDFFDRTRMATWIRDHPGLVPWVRAKAGRPITGWQSYGAWANPAEDPVGEYLTDDAARIRTGGKNDDDGLPAIEGINRIRERLSQVRTSARLVGLSGVGKTRLAQALFDDRVGANPLDPGLALYTNLGDGPDPSPVAIVSNLIVTGNRFIVVVDNCPPDLHRRLTEIAAAEGSQISILTVEYDIREDQPEGTQFFEMEPSSLAMTEKLLDQRFPKISQVDAQRIAEFSGGNARMAIALAGTVQSGENVSGLADEELFRRLFHQNHQPDADLLKAAEACALVYSFDGEDIEDGGELARIGRLAGQNASALYARIGELRRRDLVQARSHWRAVLPHAVANRLAKLALQNIPLTAIEKHLVTEAPERIEKSFSRRLGYLHDSAEAKRIVEGWLHAGGILSDVADLDELHAEMFHNVAPIAPEAVLTGLERAARGPRADQLFAHRDRFVRLLRSLAYDAALFERCADLLVAFALRDEDTEKSEAAKILKSLFFVYLSGTHATVDQRIRVMQGLLNSGDPKRRGLGLEALRALLESSHFMSGYDFQFGSHSRDHGYRPNFQQAQAWYASVLSIAEAIATSGLPVAEAVQRTIGPTFRGLWGNAQMVEDLERVSHSILAKNYWRDGWIAARQTLSYDGTLMSPDIRARLIRLERKLRPKDLLAKVRSIVLSRTSGRVDLEEYEDDEPDPGNAYQRAETLAEKLGEEAVVDEMTFQELLPELVGGAGRLIAFGLGLAKGTAAPRKTWEALVDALGKTPKEQRNGQALKGFLRGLNERDAELAGALLDEAITHPALCNWFPELQCSVPIDKAGVARLRRSLELGHSPIGYFGCLAWGRVHEPISAADLKGLVQDISARPEGNGVALEIVFYRLFGDKEAKRAHDPEVIDAGRALLEQFEFGGRHAREDHELGLVVSSCLAGPGGEAVAAKLCLALRKAVDLPEINIENYHGLFDALCKTQPQIVLEALFDGSTEERLRKRPHDAMVRQAPA